uniref:PDZ domain-containing protein n=1 Tax=Loa loa TaxID=7209 RepID=A0A1I7VLF5_LOALO
MEESKIQKESLADKAGLQIGDTVTEFSGRTTKGMSLQEATNIVDRVSLEIYMLLQRQVTEHSCLPWQLTEKNNQITVDHIKPQTVNYNYYKSERKDISHSTTNYEVPITDESPKYRTSSYSKHEGSSLNRPVNLNYQPVSPFTNVTNVTKRSESPYVQSKRFQDSYSTNSYRAESRNISGYGSDGKPISGMSRNVPIALGTSAPSSAPLTTSTSNQTGPKNKIYGLVHVDTSNAYSNVGHPSGSGGGHRPARNASTKPAWQDSGSRVPFQHSPRSERQLSPHATVRHLQYNSPMNLYSPHAAAEQYIQQTGGLFGTDPSLQLPKGDEAYLKSETRRLIAEEEGQSAHDKSASMQSASFKRISRACGTPVD